MAGHEINTDKPGYRLQVVVDGTTLADTTEAVALSETGYPVRHYLPRKDVRMDLLTKTELSTHCPFKGDTEYFSFAGNENLAWSYPGQQSLRDDIVDLVAFTDERVDTYIDGALRG